MRKALIPAFLLVVTAIVLGSTVFREQVVNAATTPFQNVVVQNTTTNPIPVQQVGTSTTSVSGPVGIDPSKNTVKLDSGANTVKLDSNGNTVKLDSTDATNLASVESDLGNLRFDGSGNLETSAQIASPSTFRLCPAVLLCGSNSMSRARAYQSRSTRYSATRNWARVTGSASSTG